MAELRTHDEGLGMSNEMTSIAEFTPKQLAKHIDPRSFKLIILPTEKCNFRCVYCYEDFKIGKMPPEVVGGVKKLLETRAADMRRLSIEWFGGEPLLAKDIVLDISNYASQVCLKNGIIFNGAMTTNGFLLDSELLGQLVGLGVNSYQISIDGIEDDHNKTRVLANGQGTYKRIMKNLHDARSTNLHFHILIRFHITKDNAGNAVEAYEEIRKSLLSDSRFAIEVKGIEYLGGSRETKNIVPEHSDVERIASLVGSHGHNRPSNGPLVCYAAKPNSLIIRANGSLAKCTVALNSNSNNIGKISPDGHLVIDNEKFGKWTSAFESLSKKALQCPADALNLWL
ncbi:radical SAM protein [Agrobacterium rhizogenes]|uniref:radical SAM protein n=1 Tax=Rhizobium rhizogenes TaxID=359 RepID=UPI00068A8FD6|nr:radical SAM protein [Rhizobium rhizogenes]NTG91103.1 radical SAM protein [Rhizobium rhizogenes]NTI19907.1 radical SAM protein [Rhizobium rhizogenes]QRM40602.1 radical SAM protein [Rhizobium rhizogenes]